jgi:hypothetical protein
MSTFSKPCSSGWIKILRLCAAGMRRVHPYRGENSGPGKDVGGELDTSPGIREQYRHISDMNETAS